MANKYNFVNHIAIGSLKIFYYYAKIFGMTYFIISDHNQVEYSLPTHITSVAMRLISLFGFISYVPSIFNPILLLKDKHRRAVTFIQTSSLILFNTVFTLSQVICKTQFIGVVNRSISILSRISKIAKEPRVIGREFCILLWIRFAAILLGLVVDLERIVRIALESGNIFISDIFGYILTCGISIMVNIVCLGYITSSTMYANIGRHMESFPKRIQRTEACVMSKYQRMQMLCNLSDELDECSVIYSQIFKITKDFHTLFQLNLLFIFYLQLVLLVTVIHHNFMSYYITGHLQWPLIILTFLQMMDFIYLMMVIDLTVRRSRIPGYIDWETLRSDIDGRWDRSVDSFLNQLRFEELNIDVFGLFQLNNALSLKGFSVLFAYLTILIQFSMLGYFQNEASLSL